MSLLALPAQAGGAAPGTSPAPGTPDDAVTIRVIIQPLIIWLWIGGGIMALGTVLCLFPGRRRRPTDAVSARSGEDRPIGRPAGRPGAAAGPEEAAAGAGSGAAQEEPVPVGPTL